MAKRDELRVQRVIGGALLLAIGAAALLAAAGWIVWATRGDAGSVTFAVTVRNDRSTPVAIQPCDRYACDGGRPTALPAGWAHTWRTTDGDSGIHSFVVEASPGGRVLGCLGQGRQLLSSPRLRVTAMAPCVT